MKSRREWKRTIFSFTKISTTTSPIHPHSILIRRLHPGPDSPGSLDRECRPSLGPLSTHAQPECGATPSRDLAVFFHCQRDRAFLLRPGIPDTCVREHLAFEFDGGYN